MKRLKERRRVMEQEIDILVQYGEADINKKLHLFLQFPDLRRAFQEIERKNAAAQTGKDRTNCCPDWKSERQVYGVRKQHSLNGCNL
jgi:hypothetical protein